MSAIAAFFARPAIKWGLIGLAVLALIAGTLFIVNRIYSKGEQAGQTKVITDVQADTIKEVDKARQQKEKADEEVRRTPYDDRVDGLR